MGDEQADNDANSNTDIAPGSALRIFLSLKATPTTLTTQTTPAATMTSPSYPPLQNDLLLRAAHGEKIERPPIWVMRQAGRYLPEYHEAKGNRDFFECCRDPEVASTLTLQPVERFAGLIDAAIIFSDILVIPQALGMVVEMVDKKGPHFPEPLATPDDAQFARVVGTSTVDAADSLTYVYEAVARTREKLAGRVPLLGFCGAPWTLLCYMVEGGGTKLFVHSKTWLYRYPDATRRLLAKLADVCIEHLARQVQAGAQAVQVFDSWAGELSPASFRAFALPSLRRIAARLPGRLRAMGLEPVPMIVFAKGAWYALDDFAEDAAAKAAAPASKDNSTFGAYDVVGLDWQHDPAQAVQRRGTAPLVLQGNADPGVLYGTHEAITETVRDMVEGFGWAERRQGWIVNLGHGITPFVKPDDLKFFMQEIHRQTKLED